MKARVPKRRAAPIVEERGKAQRWLDALNVLARYEPAEYARLLDLAERAATIHAAGLSSAELGRIGILCTDRAASPLLIRTATRAA